jgi:hypothetical protein
VKPVHVEGLDRASLLAALYNAAKPVGLGILATDNEPMTRDQAAALIESRRGFDRLLDGALMFDCLKGRSIKVIIGRDVIDPTLYDRDNGPGACARVVLALRHAEDQAAKGPGPDLGGYSPFGPDVDTYDPSRPAR